MHAKRASGPVRGVAFHPSRALLATGGDDYKIKVWGEYQSRLPRDVSHCLQTSDPRTAAAFSPSMDTLTMFGPYSFTTRCHGL